MTMNRIASAFARLMTARAGIAPTTETITSSTVPSANSATAEPGSAQSAGVVGTCEVPTFKTNRLISLPYMEIPKPYYMFGDTCWRGPLGDVRLSSMNEINIEDNGAYSPNLRDALIMVNCLLEAYKMALTVTPELRPK